MALRVSMLLWVQLVILHMAWWKPADIVSFFVCLVQQNFQPVETRKMLDLVWHHHVHTVRVLFPNAKSVFFVTIANVSEKIASCACQHGIIENFAGT